MSKRDPIQENALRGPELSCEAWECLIPEALDGTLPAAEFAAFEKHGRECAACAQTLDEARQGAAWLTFLGEPPEMRAGLFDRILSATSRAEGAQSAPPAKVTIPPFAVRRTAIPLVRHLLEPRMLRTAAMAFFSLALTLNLLGVKLSELRLSDLRPATARSILTRQYYSAHAQVIRYYENLRFIYELEARMRELRQSGEGAPPLDAQPSPTSRNVGPGHKMPNSNPRSGGSLESRRGPRFQEDAPAGGPLTVSLSIGERQPSYGPGAKPKVWAERSPA